MLATFITFHPFFCFGLANVAIMIACGLVAVLCFGVAIGCSDSSNAAFGWPLGIVFVVFIFFIPQFRTQNHLHGPIAKHQMAAYYRGHVISIDLQEHKATMQLSGCKAPIQQEMRRFKVGYRFAVDVLTKDSSGQSYTDHRPMSRKQVRTLCA